MNQPQRNTPRWKPRLSILPDTFITPPNTAFVALLLTRVTGASPPGSRSAGDPAGNPNSPAHSRPLSRSGDASAHPAPAAGSLIPLRGKRSPPCPRADASSARSGCPEMQLPRQAPLRSGLSCQLHHRAARRSKRKRRSLLSQRACFHRPGVK